MKRAITAILLGAAVIAAILNLSTETFNILLIVVGAFGAFEFSRMFFDDRIERFFLFILI